MQVKYPQNFQQYKPNLRRIEPARKDLENQLNPRRIKSARRNRERQSESRSTIAPRITAIICGQQGETNKPPHHPQRSHQAKSSRVTSNSTAGRNNHTHQKTT